MEQTIKRFCSLLAIGLENDSAETTAYVDENMASKSQAKEKLYALLRFLEENKLIADVAFDTRLFAINVMVWAEEFGILTRNELNEFGEKLLHQLPELDKHIKKDAYVHFFRPLNNSYVKAIFEPVRHNLHKNDNLLFLQGMQDFFNQTLLFFTRENNLNFAILPNTISVFYDRLKQEIERAGELSFGLDDERQLLSFGQVYRLFLDSFCEELFQGEFALPGAVSDNVKRKLLLETNINVAAKVIYRFLQLMQGDGGVKDSLVTISEQLVGADEDEQDKIAATLNEKVFLILDEIELAIYLQRYDEINRNQSTLMSEPTYRQVKKLLTSYQMEPHFTRYSIIKFFEFNPLIFLNRIDLAMFVREVALIAEILHSDKLEIPDGEIRFFIDRILQQTRNLKDFARMASIFRANLKNYERHEILHNLLEEARLNKRIATALFSFYLGAMLEVEFGQNIPLPDIEIIANRLGSTFSITRRFHITQSIRQLLQRGEIDNTPVDKLLKQNLLSLKLQHKINELELFYSFAQYLKIERFYPPQNLIDEADIKPQFEKLAKEVIVKTYQLIKGKYSEEFAENPEPLERYRILIFAENKVCTLLGQELDRRRREPELADTGWQEIEDYLSLYINDSYQFYQEQKNSRKINLADLYIEIQNHATHISVTMTYLKNRLEELIRDKLAEADFDMIQNIQIVFGGIAIHHRQDQLNVERIGFTTMLNTLQNEADKYQQLVLDSLADKYGTIEVKDPYGKTRTFAHNRFAPVLAAIKQLPAEACAELLASVIQQDLFKEVYDALLSSRNMAKNSGELHAVLSDINEKNAELLARANEYFLMVADQ
jgi:hypothetical protein